MQQQQKQGISIIHFIFTQLRIACLESKQADLKILLQFMLCKKCFIFKLMCSCCMHFELILIVDSALVTNTNLYDQYKYYEIKFSEQNISKNCVVLEPPFPKLGTSSISCYCSRIFCSQKEPFQNQTKPVKMPCITNNSK